MFVKVEYVRWLKSELRKINEISLSDITWLENEQIINVDSKVMDDFDFCGLSNIDFIMSGEYKRNITK